MTVDFVVPASLDEAVAALGEPGAVALAGGTSVGLLIGQGLLEPGSLVWLGRLAELRGISLRDDRLVLGAASTLAEVAAHPEVRRRLPALASAAAAVGNIRVRAVATVGGALAHADPRQDVPVALLALDARVTVVGRAGRRTLGVDELAAGLMTTDLAPDEVVTEVTVQPGTRSAYRRFTPASTDDYPTVAVAAAVRFTGGAVTAARVAVGGAGPTAYMVPEAAALVGARQGATPDLGVVAEAAARMADPVDDRLGSPAYKRRMVAVWVRRAVADLLA